MIVNHKQSDSTWFIIKNLKKDKLYLKRKKFSGYNKQLLEKQFYPENNKLIFSNLTKEDK